MPIASGVIEKNGRSFLDFQNQLDDSLLEIVGFDQDGMGPLHFSLKDDFAGAFKLVTTGDDTATLKVAVELDFEKQKSYQLEIRMEVTSISTVRGT